ncbi:hypothetical protein KAR52_03200 [Candidatus Pacearchaeota archaeon]|nr:hypothetical protein [Candidatus Pacearchaeota archaeon]
MTTTIQISDNVKLSLDKMRLLERESYNDLLEFMIEDNLELNKKTKLEIEERRKNDKIIPHDESMRILGL